MDIQISKDSDVPLHEQVAAQLVFLIGTGTLKPGAALPSVRALAHRLGVHRNTISKAYHDLTLNLIAEKRAGRRLAVRASEPETGPGSRDLDDLVRVVITDARRRGYSLRQVHDRLRDRLLAAPPDHLLVLSDDPGMRLLLSQELKERFNRPVKACTPDDLLSNPERRIGALVISPQGHIPKIRSVLAPERPAIAIAYSSAGEHLQAIRRLESPSLIGVVSVSPYFLKMARGVLAPAVGRRHSMRGYLMTGNKLAPLGAADLLFCDALTYPLVRLRYQRATVAVHRLVSSACLARIAVVIE